MTRLVCFIFTLFSIILGTSQASVAKVKNVVNVYAWGGEIPREIIQQFEKETGISVHFSTYDNNETLYSKLRIGASLNQGIYDVILPSNYFVERMRKHGLLAKLDHHLIPNLKYLDPAFLNPSYDFNNDYSIPFIWGATGIFYNKALVEQPPLKWEDLWHSRWKKQIMLLDDMREMFAIALLSLGFNPNDSNPEHIYAAYKQLSSLIPNIKLFASESIQAIMIDEDATLGTAWGADAMKANVENPAIAFTYPNEGMVMWVDCFAIPLNPPHPNEAYQFINFMLKPDIAAKIGLLSGQAITNLSGKALLPQTLRENPMIYPSADILKQAYFQHDIEEAVLEQYAFYWQKLKSSF